MNSVKILHAVRSAITAIAELLDLFILSQAMWLCTFDFAKLICVQKSYCVILVICICFLNLGISYSVSADFICLGAHMQHFIYLSVFTMINLLNMLIG